MKEIKVEFIRYCNVLVARVLDMPNELRGTGEIIGDGTYSVMSHNSPELYFKSFYLNGELRDYDNTYMCHSYNSSKQAKHAQQAFEKLIGKWNAEHREILDDAEKAYLSAVIKPFKGRIEYIIKIGQPQDVFEYISLRIKSIKATIEEGETMLFPYFRVGTMYKGMEANKEYTPKELGLE